MKASFSFISALVMVAAIATALGVHGGDFEDRAKKFLANVIMPFNELYDRGKVDEALHLYQEQYYKVITHYTLADEVLPLIDPGIVKKTDIRVKDAIKTCGPKENGDLLRERIAERNSAAQIGIPSISRSEKYPTMKLRTIVRYNYSAPYNRLSLDGQFLLFEEDFGDWGEMESQGISVMTMKGHYISRMICRIYEGHQEFLWDPAGGNAAILANMDGAIELCTVATGEKRYFQLKSTEDIKLYDWSSDGTWLLFGILEIDRDYMQDSAPLKSVRTGLYVLDCSKLTREKLGTGTSARFSSDGASIVCIDSSYKEYGPVLEGDIILVDRRSGSRTRVAVGSEPRFSPDNSKLLFLRHSGNNVDVIMYDLETKKEHVICSCEGTILNPSWLSRDEIVYNSRTISPDGKSCTVDIYWRNLMTGESAQLTNGGNNLLDPHWLNTGKEIACVDKKLTLVRKKRN
jgi:dipeptidyl aminopeptidase/acylaminoacyl peptidase